MQKWATMLTKTGKALQDPSSVMKQMREDSRLLNLTIFNNLALANTFGHHTQHPQDGPGIAQTVQRQMAKQ